MVVEHKQSGGTRRYANGTRPVLLPEIAEDHERQRLADMCLLVCAVIESFVRLPRIRRVIKGQIKDTRGPRA